MAKKRLPVFVFTLSNQLGISLISAGFMKDVNGDFIEETKKYDLKMDCNGKRVYPSTKQKAKVKATLKTQSTNQ